MERSIGQFRRALPAAMRIAGVGLAAMFTPLPLAALVISGYSPAANDRFSAGFPDAPVANTDPAFIGLPFDWSGVGWTPSDLRKGFGFVSPQHYLVARHFGGGASIVGLDDAGGLQAGEQIAIENTDYGVFINSLSVGDLSLGTLREPLSSIFRHGVLDLNNSSTANSPAAYTGQPLLAYGRGALDPTSPRIGAAALFDTVVSGLEHFFLTSRTGLLLEIGDSGSPVFADWVNPDGEPELALVGNNAAINDMYNFHNFLGTLEVMGALNTLMNDDGRALRVVGNPEFTWAGELSGDLSRNRSWGLGGNPNATGATGDRYVLFDASTAVSRSVNVDTHANLRGIYFKGTAAPDDGFTFGGASVLTIGRGGITNYDGDAQQVAAPLALGASQYWEGGAGGLALTDLDTAGHLLEIRSGGTVRFDGAISGGGSLALAGGELHLTGASTFTGPVWAHAGTLRVDGDIRASAALVLGVDGLLAGSGAVAGVSGAGVIAPGPGEAILEAASVDASAGTGFVFQFTSAGPPDTGNPSASLNDLLRLSGATPFAAPLGGGNPVQVLINAGSIAAGDVFLGGFFTDAAADFTADIAAAGFVLLAADPDGAVLYEGSRYSAYAGPLAASIGTVPLTANFAGGDVDGHVLQIAFDHPATYAQWAAAAFPPATPAADREPAADPNRDGILNLLAYAFRLDPLADAHAGAPRQRVDTQGHAPELLYQFRRNLHATDLEYIVELGDNLSGWTAYAGALAVLAADPDGDGGAEWVEARVAAPVAGNRQFLRLRVELAAGN
jgi:hypothetical protein